LDGDEDVVFEEARTEVSYTLVELHASGMIYGRHGRNSVDGDMHGVDELGGDEDDTGMVWRCTEALLAQLGHAATSLDADVDNGERGEGSFVHGWSRRGRTRRRRRRCREDAEDQLGLLGCAGGSR
jgi:hypothetical protein